MRRERVCTRSRLVHILVSSQTIALCFGHETDSPVLCNFTVPLHLRTGRAAAAKRRSSARFCRDLGGCAAQANLSRLPRLVVSAVPADGSFHGGPEDSSHPGKIFCPRQPECFGA